MSKGKILSVKVGLGFGKCKVLLVGGKFDRFECLVVGEAMRQACTSECHCKSGGETVVSEDVYSQIEEFYDFVEAEPDTEHGPGDGLKYYKYIGKKTNDKIQTRADAFLMRTRFKAGDLKDKLAQLKTFVPAAITIYLDIEKEVWSKESRLVTIMFLNLTIDLKHTKTEDGLQYIQKVIKTVQNCIYCTKGSLNKFLMDDKGSVLLIAWGIPPISAHDDPIRAVLTGLNIVNELKNIKNEKWGNCGAKIGITTGYCFSGVCGNIGNRREYSFLGEVVNLSARYMQQAMSMCNKENKKYQIVLCENTRHLIQDKILCKWVAKGKLKGFTNEFNFYQPIEKEDEPIPLALIVKTHRDNPKIDIDGRLIPDFLDEALFIIGRDKEIKYCLELLDTTCNSISCESKMILIKGIIGSGKSLFIRKILYEFFEQNKKLLNALPEMKKGNFQFLFVTRQLPTMLTTLYNGCCDFFKKIYFAISSRIFEKNILVKIKDGLEVKTDEFGEILVNNNYFQYITFIDEILESNILSEHFDIDEKKREQIKSILVPFEEPNLDKFFQRRNLKNYITELHKFFIYLVEFYQKRYIKGLPLILIIEDTQLIDNYSIQLINLIHALPKTFIICTYQDSLNPYVKQEPPLLEFDEFLELKGLADSKEVFDLISNFCKKTKKILITGIEPEAFEAIIDHSFKNNPLFLIEIVDSLLIQGALVLEQDILVPSPEFKKCIKILDWSKLTIPFLVEKVVGNIIDSLKCTEIITLKHACVIGAIFDIDKLNHLNIINKITREDLIQMIYDFSERGLVEILYDLNPKRIVAKFSIPFLKEILYKRMLVETKNEIHIKVARLMESSKFTYLPKEMENNLLNFHLMEEEKTILDHMDDTKDKQEQEILKDANLRIQVLKETTDKIKDIDLKTDEFGNCDLGGGIVSKRSMPIIKCGTIEKKSDKGITWENRFVIATKTKFYYWYTSVDYMNNKQYLGMFELKNIYDIKVLRDFEFSDKKNLMEVKVSSYYKKDILKGGRNYIFSVTKKNDLSAWVIALNFLRVKSIYDELRYSFGTINFPLNHEKNLMDKRREKRKFHLNKSISKAYNSVSYYFGSTFLARKKTDKKNSCFFLNQSAMNIEKKEETENEIVSKLKTKIENLTTLTFGYFIGIIQSKLNKKVNDENLGNELCEPRHLNVSIKRNKIYKKIEFDYQRNQPPQTENSNEESKNKINEEKNSSIIKKEEISNKSEDSCTHNNSDDNNIKTGLGYNNNNNSGVNQQQLQQPSSLFDMDAKDKLQALSSISLKNDILDEQIKMMIFEK